MSLSPIFSIMRDFLVVVREGGSSEVDGPKLRDMCKDLGATFLLSPAEEVLLLNKDEPFPIFVDLAEEIGVEVGTGFDILGVESCGALAIGDTLVMGDAFVIGDTFVIIDAFVIGDAGFFFILEMFLSLLARVI